MIARLLFVLFALLVQCPAKQDVCPPWSIPDNSSNTGCSCGIAFREEIKCSSKQTLLQFGFCMTYDNVTETTQYAKCPYAAEYPTADQVYIKLPQNVSLLNDFMCGPLNREGTLCGRCKPEYGPALYSYTLQCERCWDHGYGWALYFAIELLPITVLYLLVMVFHIRATCSALSALVFMSQVAVYTVRLHTPLHMYIKNEVKGFPYTVMQVLLTLCGIWSLDFFRSVVPPFCVSSSLNNIHALSLEYLVAIYPICLIAITHTCIKLHNNNFRPLVWLWKPFHRHVANIRRRCMWDSRASIINAFATFLLLSYSKILFVSFTLVYTVKIRYSNGKKKCILYYDQTVDCHDQAHFIFPTLAICVLIVFIISPVLLLILYPTRLFRRCIMFCGSRRWNALRTFVEAFQGEYKDGTNGTCDLRIFSALFFILRILALVSYLQHHYRTQWPLLWIQVVVTVTVLCVITITRPYKENYRNIVDSLMLTVIVLLILIFITILYFQCPNMNKIIIAMVLVGLPHAVLLFYICYKLAEKAGLIIYLKTKYHVLKQLIATVRHALHQVDIQERPDNDSFPDRLQNPENYGPNAQEHTTSEPPQSTESTREPRRLTPVYTYGSIY